MCTQNDTQDTHNFQLCIQHVQMVSHFLNEYKINILLTLYMCLFFISVTLLGWMWKVSSIICMYMFRFIYIKAVHTVCYFHIRCYRINLFLCSSINIWYTDKALCMELKFCHLYYKNYLLLQKRFFLQNFTKSTSCQYHSLLYARVMFKCSSFIIPLKNLEECLNISALQMYVYLDFCICLSKPFQYDCIVVFL